jgi:hypothetical protein
MRYRLRTLLIVLALGPVVIWGGWLGRESLRPKRTPWYIYDGGEYFAPGPEFKLGRKARRIILTGDDQGKLPTEPTP